ncbi:MAG: ABC transporter substrate-binding protein [Deltaproteobacteria bacterium]|nr:ABC transporter substrate-binding protein [Deltaproteobacteria bacterium]
MRHPALKIALAASALMAILASSTAHATVIAAMMSSDQPRYREAHRAFVKSMAMRGYAAPGTEIILQAPNPDPLSWSNTVRKFNAHRPDLIVAYGAPAALIAFQEADQIPVVSVDVLTGDHPQKGMCGVSSRVPMVTLLKTIQDIRPYRRIGVLYTPREAGSQGQLDEIKKLSVQFGMTVLGGSVTSPATLETALNNMLDKAEVIVATEGGLISTQFDRIVSRARARNIPVVSTMPDAAVNGAIVSLEINPQEQGHLAAGMASRILEGAKTEHLSLLTPHRIDLVINMRAARLMGIEVPFSVLRTATRLIK